MTARKIRSESRLSRLSKFTNLGKSSRLWLILSVSVWLMTRSLSFKGILRLMKKCYLCRTVTKILIVWRPLIRTSPVECSITGSSRIIQSTQSFLAMVNQYKKPRKKNFWCRTAKPALALSIRRRRSQRARTALSRLAPTTAAKYSATTSTTATASCSRSELAAHLPDSIFSPRACTFNN